MSGTRRNFSAVSGARDQDDCLRELEGKGRSFVEQDKGPAVRYGIFEVFFNELTAFFRKTR